MATVPSISGMGLVLTILDEKNIDVRKSEIVLATVTRE